MFASAGIFNLRSCVCFLKSEIPLQASQQLLLKVFMLNEMKKVEVRVRDYSIYH